MKLKTEVRTEVNSRACTHLKDMITQKKEHLVIIFSEPCFETKFRVLQTISGASRRNSVEAFS